MLVQDANWDIQATNSICAAGWRLPVDGPSSSEFATLMATYELVNGEDVLAGQLASPSMYRLVNPPLYFVRTGDVNNNPVRTSLYGAGIFGVVWSATPSFNYNDRSNNFFFTGENGIKVSNTWNRYAGYSIRCIAK